MWEPTKEEIELNGVVSAIIRLQERTSDADILKAIEDLEAFARYLRQHSETPIFWHDFMKQEKERKKILFMPERTS